MESWKDMMEYNTSERAAKNKFTVLASAPLNQDLCLKVWRQYCGTLHIMNPESQYYNSCTQMSNLLQIDLDDDSSACFTCSLNVPKAEAAAEFFAYTTIQRSAREQPDCSNLHLVSTLQRNSYYHSFRAKHDRYTF